MTVWSMTTFKTGSAAALATLLLGVGAPGVATAQTGMRIDGADPIATTGGCSVDATWRLAAWARNQGLVVELQITSTEAGQKWKFVGGHNRVRVLKKVRFSDSQGNVAASRRVVNLTGVDVFRVTARNKATDEICRAVLNF